MASSLQIYPGEWAILLRYKNGRSNYRGKEREMAEGNKIDRYLNLSGLLCPNPSLITAKKLEDMKSGETLEVVCSDKSVKLSIPDLCRKAKYKLVETREERGLIHFVIRK